MIRSFRDLRVWQAGMSLAEMVYEISRDFPRHEIYGLGGQVQRAAVSIPANIAEGHTRESTKEYLQHLSIARASLAEAETQMELAGRLGYIAPERLRDFLVQSDALSRQLFSLRQRLVAQTATDPPAPP